MENGLWIAHTCSMDWHSVRTNKNSHTLSTHELNQRQVLESHADSSSIEQPRHVAMLVKHGMSDGARW